MPRVNVPEARLFTKGCVTFETTQRRNRNNFDSERLLTGKPGLSHSQFERLLKILDQVGGVFESDR
jgi:hypothetical protein